MIRLLAATDLAWPCLARSWSGEGPCMINQVLGYDYLALSGLWLITLHAASSGPQLVILDVQDLIGMSNIYIYIFFSITYRI